MTKLINLLLFGSITMNVQAKNNSRSEHLLQLSTLIIRVYIIVFIINISYAQTPSGCIARWNKKDFVTDLVKVPEPETNGNNSE